MNKENIINEKNNKKSKIMLKLTVFLIFALFILVISLKFTLTKIPPGYIGIQYSLNGGIRNEVLEQGLRFKSPIVKVTKYPVSRQQVYLSMDAKEGSQDNDSFYIPTSDGKTVNVDLEFAYKFDPEKIAKTYLEFRGKSPEYIENTFIRAKMKSWTGEVSSKFSLIDIYGEKRTDLNKAVQAYVQPKFEEYGILVDSVSFTQIRLDEQTSQAIQNKINKQQELETAKLELEKQKIENERKIAQAQADSEQIKIRAQAEAEANKIVANSITEALIKDKEAQARLKHGWVTVTSGNTTTMVQP